jgi:hypothetical protein
MQKTTIEDLREDLRLLGLPDSKMARHRWGWASSLIVYLFKENCRRLVEIEQLRNDLREVRMIALRAGRDTPRIPVGSVDTRGKTSKPG